MPEIFGMNMNAEIIYQFKESTKVIECVLALQPRETGATAEGEKEPDDKVMEIVGVLAEKVPLQILKEGEKKAVIVNFSDPLEICLVQEIERFNKLLEIINNS